MENFKIPLEHDSSPHGLVFVPILAITGAGK